MSMADLFLDALTSIDQIEAAPSLTRERKIELCSIVRESVQAISERLAPGEDHDLDCASIIPSGDYLTVSEAESRNAFLWKAAEEWHRRNRPGKVLVSENLLDECPDC